MTKFKVAIVICTLVLTSACGSKEGSAPPEALATTRAPAAPGEQKVVAFTGANLNLEGSISESSIAFLGTVDRITVEPFGAEIEGTMAKGRRIAWVKVADVRRGDIEAGATVAVWYGTELADGVTSEDDTDITLKPEVGQNVYVLATEASQESPEIAALGYPLFVASEGSGIGVIEDGDVTTRVDTLPLSEVDRLVAEA